MFVQTHYQRVRHQATAAAAAAAATAAGASLPAAGRSRAHSHSSGSQNQHASGRNQQRERCEPGARSNHANQGHARSHSGNLNCPQSQQKHSHERLAARASVRAAGALSERKQIKQKEEEEEEEEEINCARLLHRTTQTGWPTQSQQSAPTSTREHQHRQQHDRVATHRLQRACEFDEGAGQQQSIPAGVPESHECCARESEPNHPASRQQMSTTTRLECFLASTNATKGESKEGGGHSSASASLRLRSASLSRLGQPPRSAPDDHESRPGVLIATAPPQAAQSAGGQRATGASCRARRQQASALGHRQRRAKDGLAGARGRGARLHHEIGRLLGEPLGPFATLVGGSLTNKIFNRGEQSSSGPEDCKLHASGPPGGHLLTVATAATAAAAAAARLLQVLLLLTPLRQTLVCLAHFFLNFLHYQGQTLRHLLEVAARARVFWGRGEPAIGGAADHQAASDMRAQRPMTAGTRAAQSFDTGAACRLLPHGEFAPPPPNAAHHPAHLLDHNHHHHQHIHKHEHDLEHQHQHHDHLAQSGWPLFDQQQQQARANLIQGGPDHIHRHNHAGSLAAHYGRPAGHARHFFVNNFDGAPEPPAPLAAGYSNYRSLDCEATHPSGNFMFAQQQQQQQQPLISGQISGPARARTLDANPGDLWLWHMRHTVDGCPPAAASHLGQPRPAAACSSSTVTNYWPHRPEFNRTGGGACEPADAHFGMPPRQRVVSVSSPTLSECDDSNDYWGLRVGGARAEVDACPVQRAPRCHPAADGPRGGRTQRQPSASLAGDASAYHWPPSRQLRPTQAARPQLSVDQRPLDRRLSSIMGSDSELYARRESSGGPLMSVDYNSSSSSNSSPHHLAGANLMRLQLAKQSGSYIHQAPAGHLRTKVPNTTDRRRLARQASSTSGASQSCAAAASTRVRGTGAGAPPAHRAPKLTHQLHSLQANSSSAQTTATTSPSLGTKSARASKSEPGSGHHQPTASQSALANGTTGATSGGPPHAKGLAASGKSKSVVQQHQQQQQHPQQQQQHPQQQHASPIGVLGRAVSLAGAKRRLGFKQKGGLNSLSVHRSEEILPRQTLVGAPNHHLASGRNTTASNSLNSNSDSGDGGAGGLGDSVDRSTSSSASRWLAQFATSSPDPRVCFVQGLGVGQIASRQALVSPYLGDIQLSLSARRGMLEVEVIRVRQLQPRPGAKRLPSPYVKVYLMREKKCAAKFKTRQARQTLDPLYQQLFIFRDDYSNCVLQVIVWADYGKKERKALMGIVQIHLNDLDMSELVIGWYKLFNAPSMVAATASAAGVASSSKALRQTLSSTKLGDLATIQRQQVSEPRALDEQEQGQSQAQQQQQQQHQRQHWLESSK